jgi:hypothetical protein
MTVVSHITLIEKKNNTYICKCSVILFKMHPNEIQNVIIFDPAVKHECYDEGFQMQFLSHMGLAVTVDMILRDVSLM